MRCMVCTKLSIPSTVETRGWADAKGEAVLGARDSVPVWWWTRREWMLDRRHLCWKCEEMELKLDVDRMFVRERWREGGDLVAIDRQSGVGEI